MKNLFWTVLVLLYFSAGLIAQSRRDVVRIEGNAQVELLDTKSRVETKKEAYQRATINALERAFGTAIIQGSTTYIKNEQTGTLVKTKTVFSLVGTTSVAGEVLEVLSETYTDVTGSKSVDGEETKVTDIRCDVKIKARKLTTPPVDISSFPLGCAQKVCKKTDFKNDDPLFLYFKSPSTGYVSVYLDDNTDAFRLLPYQSMTNEYEGGMPVTADQEYIFFSTYTEHDYFEEQGYPVDEYILVAESSQDINKIFVVFSKHQINKPELKQDIDRKLLSELEYRSGYALPRSLESEKFQFWLQKNRTYSQDVQVLVMDITISR